MATSGPATIDKLFICLLFLLMLSVPATGKVLDGDTHWRGTVELSEDILIPAGITLSIAAGTVVKIQPSENTQIDPEYISHQTEILVRGALLVDGTVDRRVALTSSSDKREDYWAGIIVDGGLVKISHADLSGAEAAVTVTGGRADLDHAGIGKNRYGLVVQGGDAALNIADTVIEKNDYGVMVLNGARFDADIRSRIGDNSRSDLFRAVASGPLLAESSRQQAGTAPLTVTYGDEALPHYTVWKGRVLIDGQLRLPAEGRLVIMPGAIVEFTRRDTNRDGIGENGLQIQGLIIAKGTPEKPIVFRSAAESPRMGDWDAINIMGSDLAQNLIEYCRIENAYRGLHFHFANVAVNKTILRDNYRGAQFQESLVSITNSRFYNNKSGLQTRDSEVIFNNNEIFANLNGANFFRLNLKGGGNVFADNNREGLRIREGTSLLERNLFAGNRMGLLVADAVYGSFAANVMSGNLESGMLVRNSDHIEIVGNAIQTNARNGISVMDSRATIKGNLINANGERGLGIISFNGVITDNNIVDNRLYAIGLEGAGDIDAAGNWWGDSDLDKEIYDVHDEPDLGRVVYDESRAAPRPFLWPLTRIRSDSVWAGSIRINDPVTVDPGTTLSVMPGTVAGFGDPESGLLVHGALKARGEVDKRIVFTSASGDKTSSWLGIQLERAVGSVLENCDFSYADYGLHIHFVPMEISGCRFLNNNLGIRFRSGPIKLKRSLFAGNRIGLRAFRGNMEIFENEFRENEIAVFVREGGSGMKIHHNNFSNNERYNLRLGDFNKEDVDARHNWWGTDKPGEKIFDGRREPYIGMVEFEPFLPAPVQLKGIVKW
ncbi:MAG: right-handed parallel beta-helix repeat-containing protein [Desulfurivibrionaceae bacterium]|nr:right-handed parallel beta-helix repeat-containing protein [Desulfurivibrionaceae bacterium]